MTGDCEVRFQRVQEEFDRNFAERGELGASVCVIVDGEPVVDLWGGTADEATGRPWDRDTVNVIMSCSKGAAALCTHLLVDRGALDVEAPVAAYWPEFAKNGKDGITVRMVLSHSSGVAHVRTPLPTGAFADWALMARAIEDETPFWEPGTRHGYHGLTIGYIEGELVRRQTGRTIGRYFADEVAGPLGLDFWIGLPEEHEARVAPSIAFDYAASDAFASSVYAKAVEDPTSLPAVFMLNNGDWKDVWDTRRAHAAEIPAGGAVTNARGLAQMYASLAGGSGPLATRLVSDAAIRRMRHPQVLGYDELLLITTCYTLGFSKSFPNKNLGGGRMIIGEDAFGCPGAGGQIGFADPSYRLAFAYTMNRHGPGTGLNERGQSLIDAVYQALGSPTDEFGCWARPE